MYPKYPLAEDISTDPGPNSLQKADDCYRNCGTVFVVSDFGITLQHNISTTK